MNSRISEKGKTSQLRTGRFSREGQYYLLTTTTHERMPLFVRPEAANCVLTSLKWLEAQRRIDLEAAVLMPDHLHFVAQLHSGTLSSLMQSMKGYTSREINQILGRKGVLWQAQYHDHAIRKDEVLADVVLYCLNNPVRAGLVMDFHEYPYWYCRYAV
jgi:REP element-mobilizing transposase RayT